MEYSEQTHNELRLYILEGHFNYEQCTILCKEKIITPLGMVTFGILGESHFVHFTFNDLELHEICACTELDIVGDSESSFCPLFEIDKSMTKDFGLYTYTLEYEKTNLASGQAKIEQTFCSETEGHLLSFEFPPYKSDSHTPVTHVLLRMCKDSICINTVHTYPNEDIMVFTVSKLLKND